MDKAKQNRINGEPVVFALGLEGLELAELNRAVFGHDISLLVDVRLRPMEGEPDLTRIMLERKVCCRYLWLDLNCKDWMDRLAGLVRLICVDCENVMLVCQEADYDASRCKKVIDELMKFGIHHIGL